MKRKWPHLHHCPTVLICCLLHLYDGDRISVFSDDKVDFIAISIPLHRLSSTRNLELVLMCFPSTTYLWWVQMQGVPPLAFHSFICHDLQYTRYGGSILPIFLLRIGRLMQRRRVTNSTTILTDPLLCLSVLGTITVLGQFRLSGPTSSSVALSGTGSIEVEAMCSLCNHI